MSSKALASTSSILSAQMNSSLERTLCGMSSRSRRFRAGRITVRMPAREAATHFSLMPPTGMTTPRRLISPVIATSERTVRCVSSDAKDVAMATPALGPSFAMAPAGTWMCRSLLSNSAGLMPSRSACDFTQVTAA